MARQKDPDSEDLALCMHSSNVASLSAGELHEHALCVVYANEWFRVWVEACVRSACVTHARARTHT